MAITGSGLKTRRSGGSKSFAFDECQSMEVELPPFYSALRYGQARQSRELQKRHRNTKVDHRLFSALGRTTVSPSDAPQHRSIGTSGCLILVCPHFPTRILVRLNHSLKLRAPRSQETEKCFALSLSTSCYLDAAAWNRSRR